MRRHSRSIHFATERFSVRIALRRCCADRAKILKIKLLLERLQLARLHIQLTETAVITKVREESKGHTSSVYTDACLV